MSKPASENPVIFFDGVCNLCNGFVQFLLKRDKKEVFYFSPLQSEAAKRLLAEHTINPAESGTIILYYQNKIYEASTAVIKIGQLLGGIYKLSVLAYIFPKVFRDWLYYRIAIRRYKLFGQKDECMIPTPEVNERFLMD